MIIKDKEVVTIIRHACDQFLDYKDITIDSMAIDIGDIIKLQVKAKYYKVDTLIQVVAQVECTKETIYIKTKGIIKYGFINLDFNKIIKDHIKDYDFIKPVSGGFALQNEYVESITYGNGEMAVKLKAYN